MKGKKSSNASFEVRKPVAKTGVEVMIYQRTLPLTVNNLMDAVLKEDLSIKPVSDSKMVTAQSMNVVRDSEMITAKYFIFLTY